MQVGPLQLEVASSIDSIDTGGNVDTSTLISTCRLTAAGLRVLRLGAERERQRGDEREEALFCGHLLPSTWCYLPFAFLFLFGDLKFCWVPFRDIKATYISI